LECLESPSHELVPAAAAAAVVDDLLDGVIDSFHTTWKGRKKERDREREIERKREKERKKKRLEGHVVLVSSFSFAGFQLPKFLFALTSLALYCSE
jgi:hypothetical protein